MIVVEKNYLDRLSDLVHSARQEGGAGYGWSILVGSQIEENQAFAQLAVKLSGVGKAS